MILNFGQKYKKYLDFSHHFSAATSLRELKAIKIDD